MASPAVPTTPICTPTANLKQGVSTRSQTKPSATAKPYQPSPVPQVDGAYDKTQVDDSSALVTNREVLIAALDRLGHKVDHMNEQMKGDQVVDNG